jgi:3-deoxy-7-phosphoheptulonate synthase
MLEINEMGLPVATELLDPIIPQYIAGLVAWAAIGARTTESQTHREMASGLSMPVGFKNSTDGSLAAAINGMLAAKSAQSFLGIDANGRTCIVKTTGNPWSHIVMRGGDGRPNYDPISVEEARHQLREKALMEAIMVDCSHDNSGKKQKGQPFVWKSVLNQRIEGNDSLIGMMLESNLFEGNQKLTEDLSALKYGVSVTDECISWETTEHLLRLAHEKLSTDTN